MLSHSIATRNDTTSNPDRIPMKIDSSRNTPAPRKDGGLFRIPAHSSRPPPHPEARPPPQPVVLRVQIEDRQRRGDNLRAQTAHESARSANRRSSSQPLPHGNSEALAA